MSFRKFNGLIALMHFDFPYIHEPNDGLRDDVSDSNSIFTISGSTTFAGSESPCAEIISGWPKFGYRCAYLKAKNDTLETQNIDIINALKSQNWEIEFFAFVTSSNNNSGIINFLNIDGTVLFNLNSNNNVLSFSKSDAQNFKSINLNINNAWFHFVIQNKNGQCHFYVDGQEIATFELPSLSYLTRLTFSGFTGAIDELVIREIARNNISVPDEPYQAVINLGEIGGSGSGSLGDITLSSNSQINSYYKISAVNGKSLTLANPVIGKFGALKSGDEVFIHVTVSNSSLDELTGLYAFRKIISVNNLTCTLDSSVNEFFLQQAIIDYKVQLITVPHFKNLTIAASCTVSPANFNLNGGITIFRVKENCSVYGKILTSGLGPLRSDLLQMTHSKLIDRFLINKGGGIFIACGGTFTASNTARLGASWDGAAKNGGGGYKKSGGNAGAGYGGGGSGDTHELSTGGAGGVGGGGGGANYSWSSAGAAGSSYTGGWGVNSSNLRTDGGAQGITPGGNSPDFTNASGGGGALGCSGNVGSNKQRRAYSGACLVLLAKKIQVDSSAISTGGEGGINNLDNGSGVGGGGTGLAYLACEVLA